MLKGNNFMYLLFKFSFLFSPIPFPHANEVKKENGQQFHNLKKITYVMENI